MSSSETPSIPVLNKHYRIALGWAFEARTYIAERVTGKGVSKQACADVLAIASHVNRFGEPLARLSLETIAQESLVSRSQVVEAIKVLEALGLIAAERRARNLPNIYRFRVQEKLRDEAVTPATPVEGNDAPPPSTPPPSPPGQETKPPFDALAYVEQATEPIAGYTVAEVRIALRWNLVNSQTVLEVQAPNVVTCASKGAAHDGAAVSGILARSHRPRAWFRRRYSGLLTTPIASATRGSQSSSSGRCCSRDISIAAGLFPPQPIVLDASLGTPFPGGGLNPSSRGCGLP